MVEENERKRRKEKLPCKGIDFEFIVKFESRRVLICRTLTRTRLFTVCVSNHVVKSYIYLGLFYAKPRLRRESASPASDQ